MRPTTARTMRRLSELGHRVAEDDPHRPDDFAVHDALERLSSDISRLTEAVEDYRGNILNHVLFSGTGHIPAAGDAWWTTQTSTPFARVVMLAVTNDVRVEASAPRDAGAVVGPREGRGMLWVPAVAGRVEFPLVGTVITVYGTAGSYFDLALITKAPA